MRKAAAALLLTAQFLAAQADPWAYWSLSRLQPGREITVETFAPKRKLKGVFAGRDKNGITLRLKSGSIETLSRESIRKVTAKRKGYDYAPLIGAGAGAGILGAWAGRPRMDLAGEGVALIAAVGAGIGAGIGFAVRAGGNDELIYVSAPAAPPPAPSRSRPER